jgi:hypothetical protein
MHSSVIQVRTRGRMQTLTDSNDIATKPFRPDPRLLAVFLLLEIQENETVMKGRKTFKGNAKLQRIIEYLANTD